MRKIKKTTQTKSFSIQKWLRRIWIGCCILLAAVFLGFCVWGYHSGFFQNKWKTLTFDFHSAMGDIGFTLDDIFVDGRNRSSIVDIKAALNIPENRLITTLDMKQMQENLKALPWIKDAIVMRQLPNILYIKLIERRPIALWQKNKKHYPLDEEGNVVDAMCDECPYLPVVVGDDAPQKAPEFISALEEHETLYMRTISAVLINGRRWNLYIDDIDTGMLVLLPDIDLNNAFNRLDELQKEHQVLDKKIKKLDLRFKDKTIVEPSGKDAVSLPEKKGK